MHVKDLSAEGRAEFDERLAAGEEDGAVRQQHDEEARQASVSARAQQLGHNPVVIPDGS